MVCRTETSYIKCLNCRNLAIKNKMKNKNGRKIKSYEFTCRIYDVSLTTLIKSYEKYEDCIFYIPKIKGGLIDDYKANT